MPSDLICVCGGSGEPIFHLGMHTRKTKLIIDERAYMECRGKNLVFSIASFWFEFLTNDGRIHVYACKSFPSTWGLQLINIYVLPLRSLYFEYVMNRIQYMCSCCRWDLRCNGCGESVFVLNCYALQEHCETHWYLLVVYIFLLQFFVCFVF